MAIGSIQGGTFYDVNRDVYYNGPALSPREAYEREMHYRRQEEEYRKMQHAASYNPAQQQAQMLNKAPMPDPKDPLAFLKKADSKLLLTGETS